MHLDEFPPYYFVSGHDVRCPVGHDHVSPGMSTPVLAPVITQAQAIEARREMQARATAAKEAAFIAEVRATPWVVSLCGAVGNN